MKFETWKDIINSDKESINLIGYGSIINDRTTIESKVDDSEYIVKGFERNFTSSYDKKQCKADSEKNKMFTECAKEELENPLLLRNNLTYLNNSGAFNIIKNKEKFFNGIMITIKRKDFKKYSLREKDYHLIKVNALKLPKERKEKYNIEMPNELFEKIAAYVVIIPQKELIMNADPFYLYYKSTRNGAFRKGLSFLETFDNTCFHNNELAYKYIMKKFYPYNKKVKIISTMTTQELLYEIPEHIMKYGEEGIVINHTLTMLEVMFKDGKKLYFDMNDIAAVSDN